VKFERRLKSLERKRAQAGCRECGPDCIWWVESMDDTDFYEAMRSQRCVCPRCGRDWTGKWKAYPAELRDLV
jgi:hypothetical protein